MTLSTIFKKNKYFKDDILEDAINFMINQKNINQKNIKSLKNMGFSTQQLLEWDNIYNFIIKELKSMRK